MRALSDEENPKKQKGQTAKYAQPGDKHRKPVPNRIRFEKCIEPRDCVYLDSTIGSIGPFDGEYPDNEERSI
jgi:hypothetical protein